jgi:hypothetical protein
MSRSNSQKWLAAPILTSILSQWQAEFADSQLPTCGNHLVDSRRPAYWRFSLVYGLICTLASDDRECFQRIGSFKCSINHDVKELSLVSSRAEAIFCCGVGCV